jgi:DNA modification methylase
MAEPGWCIDDSANWFRVANDDRADWRDAWALFPGDVAYVWCASLHLHEVADSLIAAGFLLRASIIWAKNRHVLSQGHYHWQHEPCWYAVRRGATGHWQGARDQSTIWSIASTGAEDAATTHGTQKPVEAMRRPIVNNSGRGDSVYDPFTGSGTTVIAAETVGRTCLAMELDPAYCDVVVARWQAFTGQVARRVTEELSARAIQT